jgi:hypothetical protein
MSIAPMTFGKGSNCKKNLLIFCMSSSLVENLILSSCLYMDVVTSSTARQTLDFEIVNNIFVFQVLVTLRYLGKGSYFSECGDLHGISKSSVCRAVEDVTTSIYKQLDNIKFPTRDEDIQNIHTLLKSLIMYTS